MCEIPARELSLQDKPIVYVIHREDSTCDRLAAALGQVGIDVDAYASARQFLSNHDAERAGCLVADLQLTEMSGLDLIANLRDSNCHRPFILLSGSATISAAVEAMRRGAHDVLETPCDAQRLIGSVNGAIRRDLAERRARAGRADFSQRMSSLTDREREVLKMVVDGRLTKQIAKFLGISVKTVEVHRSNITKKMGVESVPQLVRLMIGPAVETPSIANRSFERQRSAELAGSSSRLAGQPLSAAT